MNYYKIDSLERYLDEDPIDEKQLEKTNYY